MATSDSRTIPWQIEPQTVVKHELLRTYIATWMKILWQQQELLRLPPHLIYVDGFAGPGEYWTTTEQKEKVDGSPIIVGKIANDLLVGKRKLDIIAFDSDRETIEHLQPKLHSINTHSQEWEASHEDFLSGATNLIGKLTSRLGRDYPTFFFIDPFGYSGFPMSLLTQILRNVRTEVFITFMTYDIVRFIGNKDVEEKMIGLFGTDQYKAVLNCKTPEGRVNFITSLYRTQLINVAKAKHVVQFRINTPDQSQRARYFLFHASNHIKALKEMKNAMARKSDRELSFEAIGIGPDEQLDLFEASPETKIKELILGRVQGASSEQIEYSVLEEWAYEKTAGVSSDIKKALCELERDGKVHIDRKPKQQKTTVTDGAMIHHTRSLF